MRSADAARLPAAHTTHASSEATSMHKWTCVHTYRPSNGLAPIVGDLPSSTVRVCVCVCVRARYKDTHGLT